MLPFFGVGDRIFLFSGEADKEGFLNDLQRNSRMLNIPFVELGSSEVRLYVVGTVELVQEQQRLLVWLETKVDAQLRLKEGAKVAPGHLTDSLCFPRFG